MTPEELFDEFIQAYIYVLRTDVLFTSYAGELINVSVDEFIKPWCEKIRDMISAAQAETAKEVKGTIFNEALEKIRPSLDANYKLGFSEGQAERRRKDAQIAKEHGSFHIANTILAQEKK